MIELLAEQKNIEHGICANGSGAQALRPREKRRRYCHRSTLQIGAKGRFCANPAQWPGVRSNRAAVRKAACHSPAMARLQKKTTKHLPRSGRLFLLHSQCQPFSNATGSAGLGLSRSIGFFFDTRRTQWQQRKKLR
ncbi:hypothetical protein [Vandammella animalimorsus]|uniref:hypothetical protein n=1 Tax=Vandammella animalimorsus TaxID=2029117 RepID=UPI0011C48422|nr:hypothetical protein [Vandammella animalimorsus]